MFTRFASLAVASALTAALVSASAPAHADLGAPRSMTVAHGDLDLSTETGRARLSRRVAFAAETVCGPADDRSYYSRKSIAACQNDAIAAAQPAMVSVFADAGATLIVAAD